MMDNQQYVSAMLFLIALHKKLNKFNLGVEGTIGEFDDIITKLTEKYLDEQLTKINDTYNG
jgi:hypothetical protein